MEGQSPEPVRAKPVSPEPVRPAMQRPDPSSLRISDDDRHKVAEVLRQAAGEGRIDLDELDERLEAAYHAKTYGELVPITADLPAAGRTHPVPPPVQPASPSRVPVGAARYPSSLAVMSECKRVGRWAVEDHHSAFALMGSVVIDLREAEFGSSEVVLNASAVMGEVKVLVNAGTSVVVEGMGVMGEYKEQRAKVPFDPEVGGPVVRLRGFALMGTVSVQRRGAPGQGIRRQLGH
jgi:hypothetical protein